MVILKDFINKIPTKEVSENQVNAKRVRDWHNIDNEQKGFIKEDYKPILKLTDLRSNPLKIINLFYRLTIQNDEKATKRITLLEIMQELSISKDSVKTAIRFLLKNNLITRVAYQTGKLGWSQYTIEKNLFSELRNKSQ